MRRNPYAFNGPSAKTTLLTIAAAMTGLFLTACMESTQSAATGQTWHGLLRNSCGPADGPEVHVVFDTAAYADCASSHQSEYSMRIQESSIDLITVGRTLTYEELSACNTRDLPCDDSIKFRLEIAKSDSSQTQAAFRIDRRTNGRTAVLQSGTVILEKCPDRPLCG